MGKLQCLSTKSSIKNARWRNDGWRQKDFGDRCAAETSYRELAIQINNASDGQKRDDLEDEEDNRGSLKQSGIRQTMIAEAQSLNHPTSLTIKLGNKRTTKGDEKIRDVLNISRKTRKVKSRST